MTELRFDDRVAIVTGAGRGIGRAHALLLAERGAVVVVNDLGVDVGGADAGETPADDVVGEILALGGEAVADASDVSSAEGAAGLVAAAIARFGRLDVVVNNAGIIRYTDFPAADLDELRLHLAVHVGGSFNVTRAAWPHLVARGYGRLVFTTSSAIYGLPNLVSYGAAKGGVVGLARALATAGASHDIKANVISPIGLTRMMRASGALPDDVEALAAQVPPALVAPVMAYLAHETCPVTGEIYTAGGGRAARVFIGETHGVTSGIRTPEDVAAGWDEINDAAGFFVPESTHDQYVKRSQLVEVDGDRGRAT